MPEAYKMEIFSRDYQFRSVAVLSTPTIEQDYLTLQKTSVTVHDITAQRGDYAHITSMGGSVLYQGIVEDVNVTKNGYKLKLAPLLALLDVPVSYNRELVQTGALEDFIAGIIEQTYIRNPDKLQNVPGLSVETTSKTTDTKLNLKSNVHEFWDIATKALTMYGVIITAEMLPAKKQIAFRVGKATQTLTLESELPNCLNKNFVFTDTYGDTNKATYINKNDEQQSVTYYLHKDGTISTTDSDRVTPVFFTVEYIESTDEFAKVALERATEDLTPQIYKQLIELTYASGDEMIQPNTLMIGALADIHYKSKIYRSIMTGYDIKKGKTTLIFGVVRMELTKKLIIERRKDNGN